MKLSHLTTIVLGAILMLSSAGCGSGQADTTSTPPPTVKATTGRVHRSTVPQSVSAIGAIRAGTTVDISTRMMGWVEKIHVREGGLVRVGDPLISIDDRDLQASRTKAEAALAEARAVLANAEKMATRFNNLYADQSVSQQQLDDVMTGRDRAAAGVQMAAAGLAEVQVHLGYLDIVAPVAGLVTRRVIEEGNLASPGQPLLTVETSGDMKVVAQLGEKDIAKVAVGAPLTVAVTSLEGAVFSVPVTRVVRTANRGSRTYNIEASLNTADARLRSGMFARVTVPVGTREAILVPAAAIHHRGQLTGVWEVDTTGVVHLRWIRLGDAVDDDFEVLSGLDGSEVVVLKSERTLAEGDRVVN